ncbi:hypothetical protein BJ878DRAFT_175605 [Calycina marina]|uniref:Uncharacterized protein n=1 Tax=Calycina marina TaxID=1763456 RepID=A0A9P8CD96_9HELO|nr:hypothetical protein BJ878DRAFT_175605 [Calycina marina]
MTFEATLGHSIPFNFADGYFVVEDESALSQLFQQHLSRYIVRYAEMKFDTKKYLERRFPDLDRLQCLVIGTSTGAISQRSYSHFSFYARQLKELIGVFSGLEPETGARMTTLKLASIGWHDTVICEWLFCLRGLACDKIYPRVRTLCMNYENVPCVYRFLNVWVFATHSNKDSEGASSVPARKNMYELMIERHGFANIIRGEAASLLIDLKVGEALTDGSRSARVLSNDGLFDLAYEDSIEVNHSGG